MTVVPDELRAQLDEAMREQRAAVIGELGKQPMMWLAAPPLWTRAAAETTGFPVGESASVTDFVRRACDVGWCKIHGSLRVGEQAELRFWMPDEVRGDVIDSLREISGGELEVVRVAQHVAAEMHSSTRRADLPGALQAWAELFGDIQDAAVSANLVEHVRQAVSTSLIEHVRQAVNEDNLSRAQDLVAAGAALESMVAGTAGRALDRARRMLDGGRNRRADERALGRYLDRPELSGAVAGLLAPDNGKWALHLRGAGGAGKTTFIRYLTSGRFAEAQSLPPIPMACANFDHFSPDYPMRKPVQLLLEFADELAPYAAASDQAEEALRAFYDHAESAHQAFSSLRDGDTRPLDNPDVRWAVDAFADLINELGGVLLILDTCEELAKWNPGNLDSPAVWTMLDMVERLHEQAGDLRVLLAGRRRLPERQWLGRCAVAGFTVAEARSYLALPGDRRLPAELADEMIRQSRAVDEPVPDRGQLPARVNPFDLALYRAWANEEPGLSVADIRQGNDAYVESRIIQRLDDRLVLKSLPMLAAGGKCRVETIAAALGCDAASLGRQLAAQEWIEWEGGTPPVFVMAWPSMAERLRRYYRTAGRETEFWQAMQQFAEAVRRRLSDDPRAPIDVAEVVAALRWAGQPAEAAGLWDVVTGRAAQPPGQWDTVSKITDRVLGQWDDPDQPDEQEWPTKGALQAAVLAAHIAAHRRDTPAADGPELWEQVRVSARGHPDPARQRQLRVLGALGGLLCGPGEASLWDVLRTEQESLMSSPEVGTAAIGAVHRLLEAGRAGDARQLLELLDLKSFRSVFQGRPGAGRDLRPADADRPLAWAFAAEARLLSDRDPPRARNRIAAAERLAAAASGAGWLWPHWIPPEDLLARVRIERGLIDQELIAAPSDLMVLDAWEDYAAGRLRSVDGERLASLCLRLRLRHRTVPPSAADRWESADQYASGRVPTSSAHDLVPPLFVSVAEAWLSSGRPERGLALLEQRRSEANAARDDATVRYAEARIAGFARRLRLTDQRSLLVRLTSPAEYRSVARAWTGTLDDARRAWAVIYGESPPDARLDTERLAGWHAWWQCQLGEVPGPVLPVPWSPAIPDADRLALADIRTDLKEMRLLGRRDLEPVQEQLEAFLRSPGPAPWRPLAPARSADPYRDPRLQLRLAALDQTRRYTPPARAPVRLIAEMAFDEAELLALRLPAAAAWIYWVAAQAYARCRDHIGRLLALVAFRDALSRCSEAERRSLPRALSVDHAANQAVLLDAWNMIAAGHPELAAIMAGPPDEAGPWRYWAAAVQRNTGDLKPANRAGNSASPAAAGEASAAPRMARDTKAGTAVRRAVFRVLALPLAVVVFGRIRTAFRLAAEHGVGAARIETLLFAAAIGGSSPGEPGGMVRLRVRLRPWRSAPVRTRSRLRLRAIALVVRLLRSGWPGRPAGYSGSLAPSAASPDGADISWAPPLQSPRGAWWDRQGQTPVAGTIRTSRIQAGQPWERILAASLDPAAAGRIEWVRVAADQVPAVHSGGHGAELIAPPAWDRPLAGYYRRPEPALTPGVSGLVSDLAGPASARRSGPRVRHVIGRAVRTSAGPCMNVSGEPRARRGGTLLAAGQLTRGRPLVVVLQAEPADGEGTGAVRRHDLADRIRLANALLDDGVPAVLVLPALPDRYASEVARTVAAFADAPGLSGEDIQAALLRPLRAALAGHTGPAALDDIILFLNARFA
jgi:hypothetical protein